MKKNILLCSIDAPFIGGAGTNSYNLIKLLRSVLKHNVVGLFIYRDVKYDKDPHKIGNIFKYDPDKDNLDNIKKEINLVFKNNNPDIILSKNYISVLIAKKMYPDIELIFLPSGSSFYGQYCNKYGQTPVTEIITKLQNNEFKFSDVVNKTGKYPCFPKGCEQGCDCEFRAIIVADKIIPNSELTEIYYKNLYKNLKSNATSFITNKIEPAIEISSIYDTAYVYKSIKQIDFEKRQYDVVFACFNWKRKLKGLELIDKIIDSLKKYKILIIGGSSNGTKHKNITIVDCCSNDILLTYFANTRCFVSTSYYDSYPNAITEAKLCGCNIVTSKNVGQYKVLEPNLVVNDFFNVVEWVNKIEYAIKEKRATFNINQAGVLNDLNKYLS